MQCSRPKADISAQRLTGADNPETQILGRKEGGGCEKPELYKVHGAYLSVREKRQGFTQELGRE